MEFSAEFQREGIAEGLCQLSVRRLRQATFSFQDATTMTDIQFSHVYMYDKVFDAATLKLLARNLNQSTDVRVLVSYQVQFQNVNQSGVSMEYE